MMKLKNTGFIKNNLLKNKSGAHTPPFSTSIFNDTNKNNCKYAIKQNLIILKIMITPPFFTSIFNDTNKNNCKYAIKQNLIILKIMITPPFYPFFLIRVNKKIVYIFNVVCSLDTNSSNSNFIVSI